MRRQDVHVGEYVPFSTLCSRKAHLSESTSPTEDWTKAQVDFFEAFKAYDEAGSTQRTQVLKYLVLAHMLTESEIDPFDSQETKPCVALLGSLLARRTTWALTARLCVPLRNSDTRVIARLLRCRLSCQPISAEMCMKLKRSSAVGLLFFTRARKMVLTLLWCAVLQRTARPSWEILSFANTLTTCSAP